MLSFFLKINDYIPAIKPILAKHENKVLCLAIQGLPRFCLKIVDSQMQVVEQDHADVTVKGKPLHLLQIFMFGNQIGLLDIQGDVGFAQDLFACYQKENLDLPLFQDFVSMCSNRREDLQYFLQDEVKVLVTPENAEQFFKDVDNLRNRADRLEAKLLLLENRMKS